MKRALVIDGDAAAGGLIRDTLTACGIAAELHGDARTALARFVGGRYDLVLLGLSPAGMPGEMLYRDIRDLAGGAEIPVIICTAHGATTLRRRLHELPPCFIRKPFRPAELQALVRDLLRIEERSKEL